MPPLTSISLSGMGAPIRTVGTGGLARRALRAPAPHRARVGTLETGQPSSRAAYAEVQKSWMTAGGGNALTNAPVVSTTPTRSWSGSFPHDVPRPPAHP